MVKLKEQQPVSIVAILDRSGSMSTIIDDSIGGFNAFLKAQQEAPGEATISVVLFDDKYDVVVDDAPVKECKPLDNKTYVPRGTTALYDAIGKTLSKMFREQPERAIICILTDGFENASKEYSRGAVKELITQAQKRGWEVQYLAANQDAFAVGGTLGIRGETIANFSATKEGTAQAYRGLTVATTNYRSGTK